MQAQIEDRELKILEQRRKHEEERRQRILDPKKRTIGIDKAALDKQVQEKKQALLKEQEREVQWATMNEMQSKTLLHCEILQKEEERMRARALLDFQSVQTKESRREWELSDPRSLAKTRPPRLADDDPNCGPSSVQKFEGEDVQCKRRQKAQQVQQANWIQHQLREKTDRLRLEEEENRCWEEAWMGLSQHLDDMESLKRSAEKEVSESIAGYNETLAAAKRAALERKSAEEKAAEAAEVDHMLNNDMLNETCGFAMSYTNPHRVNPQNYKGMSKEQLQFIYQQQQEQINARRDQKFQADAMQTQWSQMQREQERCLRLLEIQKKREEIEKAKRLQEIQKQQAAEQKSQYKKLYNDVYQNEVNENFFSQFGTSSR
eukprot:Rmarinus@m.5964